MKAQHTRHRIKMELDLLPISGMGQSPKHWDWHRLLDLGKNETARIVYADSIPPVEYHSCPECGWKP